MYAWVAFGEMKNSIKNKAVKNNKNEKLSTKISSKMSDDKSRNEIYCLRRYFSAKSDTIYLI